MRRFCTIFALLICFPALVRGDIIRLKNGGILTGKIIQQSSADIVFASSTATSTLQRESVAEIFKTSSPDEDQELLAKMGKTVSKMDIEKDYTAGQQKLDRFLETGIIVSAPQEKAKPRFFLSLYAGAARNVSRLSSAIPWGGLTGLRFDAPFAERFSMTHSAAGELLLCRYSSGPNTLSGGILSAGYSAGHAFGPAYPFFSLLAGPGLFRIDDSTSGAWKLTPAASADAGVRFSAGRFTITPAFRALYANDREAPLISASFILCAGFAW